MPNHPFEPTAPDVLGAYARWAGTYPPRPHNRLMEVEQAAMLALLPDVAGVAALDAGCGTGRYAALLRRLGAREVVACDRSPDMLARAAGGGRMLADIRLLPLRSASIDVITCGLVLSDLDNLPDTFTELARVLRPGGSLVASLLHPRGGAEGWRRTFDTPGGVCEVPACWHSIADLYEACRAARLTLLAVREPGLAPGGDPVAVAFRADRPASTE